MPFLRNSDDGHNLTLAFPEKSEAEIEHIVRAMWSNLGASPGNISYLPLMHSIGPNPRIEVSGSRMSGPPSPVISAVSIYIEASEPSMQPWHALADCTDQLDGPEQK